MFFVIKNIYILCKAEIFNSSGTQMQFFGPPPFHGYHDLINPQDHVQRSFLQFKALVHLARQVILREDHLHPEAPHERLYKQPIDLPTEIMHDYKSYDVYFLPGNKTVFRSGLDFPNFGRSQLQMHFQDHETTTTVRININLHEDSRDIYYFNLQHFEEWIRTNTRNTTINREECLFGFFYLFLTTPIGNMETGQVMEAFQRRADAAKEIILYNAQCERDNLMWENHFREVVLPTVSRGIHPSWQQSEVLGNTNHQALEIILQQGFRRPKPYPWPENLMECCSPDAVW